MGHCRRTSRHIPGGSMASKPQVTAPGRATVLVTASALPPLGAGGGANGRGPPWSTKVPGRKTALFLDWCSVDAFSWVPCTGPAGSYLGAQGRRSGAHCCLLCWQVLNEVTEDNLIDLGPGSPAVVSPVVGNTAPPSSLSSQLAGLGKCLTGLCHGPSFQATSWL